MLHKKVFWQITSKYCHAPWRIAKIKKAFHGPLGRTSKAMRYFVAVLVSLFPLHLRPPVGMYPFSLSIAIFFSPIKCPTSILLWRTLTHYAIATRPSCCFCHSRICLVRERKSRSTSSDKMEMALFIAQFTSHTTEWISRVSAIVFPITYLSQTPMQEPSIVKLLSWSEYILHLDMSFEHFC